MRDVIFSFRSPCSSQWVDSCLTDVARSVSTYLSDEGSGHRALAIDLCSRGFQIWQQHVDAVQMLRSLFTLATTSKKESISVQNVGQQARSAILHIASTNTPLFMTTLSMDILHPQTLQHRKSVLQLVIFLIRKVRCTRNKRFRRLFF